MLKYLLSDDAVRGASVGLVMATSALVGQYVAAGISPKQFVCGVLSIAGAIAFAVIVRCWPRQTAAVEIRD